MAKRTNAERDADRAREASVLTELLARRSAEEWETFFQRHHVPAARVRTMGEALGDPQIATRGVLHRFAGAPGVAGEFAVPMSPFLFAHGGPRVDSPPPRLGEHTEAVLAEARRK